MIVQFEGRDFLIPEGARQLSIDEDVAARLKRDINKVISQNELTLTDTVIDGFAGCGFSSWLWAKNSDGVICIEQNKQVFDCLRANLGNVPNVELFNFDNRRLLPYLPPAKVVDLDPHTNFHDQLDSAVKLCRSILLLTSGEIYGIMRWGTTNRYGDISAYRGKPCFRFPDKVLVPWVLSRVPSGVLEYMYIFPTSVRMVITVNGYKLSPSTTQYLKQLPKYIGRAHEPD